MTENNCSTMSPPPLSRLLHMRQTLKSKGKRFATRVTKLFSKMDSTQESFVPSLDFTQSEPIVDYLDDSSAGELYYKAYGIYRLDDTDAQATAELLTVKKDYESAKSEIELHAGSDFGKREDQLASTIHWSNLISGNEVTVSYDSSFPHVCYEIAEVRYVGWDNADKVHGSVANWRREDEWRTRLPPHWGVFEERDYQNQIKLIFRGGYSSFGEADHNMKVVAHQYGLQDRVPKINHGKMEFTGESGQVEQRYFVASGRLVNKQYAPDNLELRQHLYAPVSKGHSQDRLPTHIVAPMSLLEDYVSPVPESSQASPGPSTAEPIYCICRLPDDGSRMICCDNAACGVEWYHLSCMGLVTPPRGKWYCGDACNPRKGKSVAVKKVAKRAGSVAAEGKGKAGGRRKRGADQLEEGEEEGKEEGKEMAVPVVKKRKIAQKKPRKAPGAANARTRTS